MLLLVFGRIAAMDVPRLRDLALRWPVRVVQVLGSKAGSKAGPKAEPKLESAAGPKAEHGAWETAQGGEHPVAVEHVHDLQGHLRQATLGPSDRWVLIRPDAYVVGSGPSGPKWRGQVTAMLSKSMGNTSAAEALTGATP